MRFLTTREDVLSALKRQGKRDLKVNGWKTHAPQLSNVDMQADDSDILVVKILNRQTIGIIWLSMSTQVATNP